MAAKSSREVASLQTIATGSAFAHSGSSLPFWRLIEGRTRTVLRMEGTPQIALMMLVLGLLTGVASTVEQREAGRPRRWLPVVGWTWALVLASSLPSIPLLGLILRRGWGGRIVARATGRRGVR